jgi:hypothetical protein
MISILQTYLPAELDLIDAEEADGITMDDVANAQYYQGEVDDQHTPEYPAIVVDARASVPIAITSTTHSPGTDQSDHEIVVSVLMNAAANEGKATLKKRILRYARAIVRVLAIKYSTLSDTVVYVKREGAGQAVYKDSEDETVYLRTAEIPFLVQTYENL